MTPARSPLPDRLGRVADLVQIAGRLSPLTAVLAGGHRVADLRLVESARDHGFVDRIILVGRKDRIAAAVAEAAISVAVDDIVNAEDDEAIAAATVELIQVFGVDLVLEGDVAADVMRRHMLPLAVRPTVSLATLFDAAPIADGRPILLTGAGVAAACSLDRMVDLVRNAVDVARAAMGVRRPRIAILSADGKPSDASSSARIALELAARGWPDALICGPISFDLATDPSAVAGPGLPDVPGVDEVAGRADVLICPGADVAGSLYKTIAAMSKYGEATLASLAVGFPVPYTVLSHADTLETRLASIALCAVYARLGPQEESPATPDSQEERIDRLAQTALDFHDRAAPRPSASIQKETIVMSRADRSRWVFRAHVVDRAGALTSIASAFSNEGVSIDTIVGHGFEPRAGVDGSVVLTFSCSEAEKDKMVRKIKRLSKVIQLEEHPYESQSLRKSALILSARELKPCDVVGETAFLTSELVKKDAHGFTYLLAGSPSDLDPVLERLETAGTVKDVIYSVLSL